MDKQAVVKYINENAAALHGIEAHRLDIGGDITANDVQSMRVTNDVVKVAVNRGVKGMPTYTIPLDALKSTEPVEKEPQKALVSEPTGLDPADLTVREIMDLELSPAEWRKLKAAEQQGKARSSAIEYIEAQI